MSTKANEGGFYKFLYNKDTGEVLGRTGTSWAKITIFYIIFYAVLAAFFLLMLYIFSCTLNTDEPKYQKESSLIGTNPGVGFRPQPDQNTDADSTLISFKKGTETTKFWSNQLQAFVHDAEKVKASSQKCEFGKVKDPSKPCQVETEKLGPCIDANEFGYKSGEPCILIKINRIFDWEPEAIAMNQDGTAKKTDKQTFNVTEFKADIDKKAMPQELKTYIKDNVDKEKPDAQFAFASSVWISCEGENPADRENIGSFSFYPLPGIPSYYFPYKKQKDYQSPFVMVQLTRVKPGVLVNIECKAWANNIIPDRPTRTGSVHFQVMVDS